MKIVYFERTYDRGNLDRWIEVIKGIYVPDRKIVLSKNNQGVFDNSRPPIWEIESKIKGTLHINDANRYRSMIEMEMDEQQVGELIKGVEEEKTLREKLDPIFRELSEQAEHRLLRLENHVQV